MRPCTNCRSTDTAPLPTGILPRIASVLGGNSDMVAYVCRVCRHVDVWLDEEAPLPAAEEETRPALAGDLSPA